MTRAAPLTRTRTVLAAALLMATCAATAAPPAAARYQPGAEGLSPRLLALSRPGLSAASPRRQAETLSLAARGPGSLQRRGNRILAELRFRHGALAALTELRAAGAEIVQASGRDQTVAVAARPADLRAIAAVRRRRQRPPGADSGHRRGLRRLGRLRR